MSEFGSAGGQSNFTQSTAYAAAVQRAREIAAKINPIGSPPEGGAKRELEDGYQPEAKKLAGSGTEFQPSPIQGNQQQLQRPQLPSVMGFAGDGTFSEEIMVPDKIVGLIIGRGGEQITRLQSESGCKIQMERSRGTAERQCTLTGSREAISRAKEMVMNIVSTLSRNDGFNSSGGSNSGNDSDSHPPFQPNQNSGPPGQAFAEIMVPGPKVGLIIGKGGETIKHLQDTTGAKMVVVQDSNSQDYEKPLRITGTQQQVDHARELVFQMIADKDMGGSSERRGRGGSDRGHFGGGPPGIQNNYNNDFDNNGQQGGGVIEILVPRAAVGVVIGKGGEMIKKIQSTTGAKLQFEQGRDDGPGDRKCILTGKPEQCDEARERVMELIDSVQRRDDRREPGRGGGGGGGGRGDRGDRDRRGGNPGADFDRQGSRNDRWGGGGGGGSRDRSERSEITFAVPANRAGFVIGKGGERIKQINAQCGAYCEIDRKLSIVNPTEKVFVIRGTPDQIEEAKRLIIEYSGIEDYYGVGGGSNSSGGGGGGVGGGGGGGGSGGSGGGNSNSHHQLPITSTAYPNQGGFQPQGWGGPNSNSYQWGGVVQSSGADSNQSQVPINPANGQPDYTLQWAEYYRSMGMMREAEMIEQQAKANKAMASAGQSQPGAPNAQGMGISNPAQTGAAGAQANGAQPDYSAQWAEYYRSMGKIKEAEAIEAQIKAKASGGGGSVAVPSGNQNSQPQPAQLMAGAPQQQPQFNQFGSYSQGNPGPYYGGPGQATPYGNYPGYGGGYNQGGGSEN